MGKFVNASWEPLTEQGPYYSQLPCSLVLRYHLDSKIATSSRWLSSGIRPEKDDKQSASTASACPPLHFIPFSGGYAAEVIHEVCQFFLGGGDTLVERPIQCVSCQVWINH